MAAMISSAAMASVGNLQMAAFSLHDAVVATKRNDKIMLDIVNTIVIRAPVIKRLLVQAVYSEDPDINHAFARAVNAVVHEMDNAKMAVYEWLAKPLAKRLFSAGEVQVALNDVLHALDRNLDHIQALQVDDIQHRVMEMQLGHQQSMQKIDACAAHVSSVMGQLENLLDRPGASPEQTIAKAKITVKCKEERAKKGGCRLEWHKGYVLSVAWSPDSKHVVTGSVDETAAIWDVIVAEKKLSLEGHKDYVGCVAWSPDGKKIATASDDMNAFVWDAETGKKLLELQEHYSDSVTSIAWSPDSTKVAAGSAEMSGGVWDASTGALIKSLIGHKGYVWSVCWSPDGSQVVTASEDKTAVIWDAATGQQLFTLAGHAEAVRCVAWSTDGTKIATASWDKTARIWDAATGNLVRTLEGHEDHVLSVCWQPDGTRVATASWDLKCIVWEVATGKALKKLEGHTDNVNTIAWSPDGSKLATASDDNFAAIWEAEEL